MKETTTFSIIFFLLLKTLPRLALGKTHAGDYKGLSRCYHWNGWNGIFPLSCCPLHVTAKVFRADCFHPSTTSKKKTINAPRVLLEVDPPAHPNGYKEGGDGRSEIRRWQLLGHHSCG